MCKDRSMTALARVLPQGIGVSAPLCFMAARVFPACFSAARDQFQSLCASVANSIERFLILLVQVRIMDLNCRAAAWAVPILSVQKPADERQCWGSSDAGTPTPRSKPLPRAVQSQNMDDGLKRNLNPNPTKTIKHIKGS